MNFRKYLPGTATWDDYIYKGLSMRVGDADALLLIPYDDGTFWLKPAHYDKELVGGIGGYETPDEDKFVVDGTGNAKRSLFGIPIALAIDPAEHAGVVEPIKALIAQKDNLGEFVRVDREDKIAQLGNGVEIAPAADGKMSDVLKQEVRKTGGDEHEALLNLAERGELSKYYDLTPKERIVEAADEEGEFVFADEETAADGGMQIDTFEEPDVFDREKADGYIVDQSKAADLLPKKWTSEKLQVMQDKARMEEHDEGKLMKYAGYGMLAGFMLAIVALGVFWFLGQIGGGVF